MKSPRTATPDIQTNTLLLQLERETDATVAHCVSSAAQVVSALQADAERRIQDQRDVALAERAHLHRSHTTSERARIERRVLAQVLEARAVVLERVLAAVSAHNPVLGRAETVALAKTHLNSALQCFPDVPVTVRCNAALVEIMREVALSIDAARIAVCEDATMPFGFCVHTAERKISVHATTDRMLGSERGRLSILVANLLHERVA